MNHAKMTKAELLIEIDRLEANCEYLEDAVAKYVKEVDMLHDELDVKHNSQAPWWGIPTLVCMSAVLWVAIYYAWVR